MNIIVGKNSGFCAGVRFTITKAEEELEKAKTRNRLSWRNHTQQASCKRLRRKRS